MKKKGQGALEYLLLIGGAVLVAAIVIALLTGVPSTVPVEDSAYCTTLSQAGASVETDCTCATTPSGSGACAWDATNSVCYYNATGTPAVCP